MVGLQGSSTCMGSGGDMGVPRPDPHMGFCLAGWPVQIAEPGNGAVPGLAAPRGQRVPRSRGSCGWGGWGLPPRAEELELPYLPRVLEPTWSRGSMLGVPLEPAPGRGSAGSPQHLLAPCSPR